MPPVEQDPWPDYPATGTREDSRQMCFSQGKAFVHMPRGDQSRILTEWPNGVVDEHLLADKSTTRKWPGGRVERFESGDPASKKYPFMEQTRAEA